ncbi:hypothetical protein [Deefgea piscis]|uniref:hypothetical protein n=1 Tax=Deefgea piscis TaxID=2739061 RepID=UPI001C7FAD6D|nr:hypothetical protein [Deefgea piscis]QZA81738.1 hypothetical protein K4H25_03500 [Deefgea piscis]
MDNIELSINAKLGALKYLLIGIISRLDSEHKGFLTEILTAIAADEAAIKQIGKMPDNVSAIFQEVKEILKHIPPS